MVTLTRVSPSSALPKVVAYVEELLSNPALLTVTVEEVTIMKYPEGVLYNTSVIKRYVSRFCFKVYQVKIDN